MDQWNSDVDQIIALLRQLTDGLADVRKQFMENQKPHLTVEELAELVGRKPYTVRSWITDGKITAITAATAAVCTHSPALVQVTGLPSREAVSHASATAGM